MTDKEREEALRHVIYYEEWRDKRDWTPADGNAFLAEHLLRWSNVRKTHTGSWLGQKPGRPALTPSAVPPFFSDPGEGNDLLLLADSLGDEIRISHGLEDEWTAEIHFGLKTAYGKAGTWYQALASALLCHTMMNMEGGAAQWAPKRLEQG